MTVQQLAMFQIGAGDFGGPRASSEEIKAATIPHREPDAVFEENIPEDQVKPDYFIQKWIHIENEHHQTTHNDIC